MPYLYDGLYDAPAYYSARYAPSYYAPSYYAPSYYASRYYAPSTYYPSYYSVRGSMLDCMHVCVAWVVLQARNQCGCGSRVSELSE